jgi:hypothetical protein
MPEKDKRPTFSEEYLETQLLDLEDHLKSEDPNLARDLEQHTIHFSLAEKLQHQASFVKTSISETFHSEKARRRLLGICGGAVVCLSFGLFLNRQDAISEAREQHSSAALHDDLSSFTQRERMTRLEETGTRLAQFYRHQEAPFACSAVGDSLTQYFTMATDEVSAQPFSNTTYTMLPLAVSKLSDQAIANADNPDLTEPFCDEPSDLSREDEREFAILDHDFEKTIASLDDGDYSAEFYGLGLDHRSLQYGINEYESSPEYIKQRAIQFGSVVIAGFVSCRLITRAFRRRKY